MIDMHQSGPNTRKVFHKLLMSFRMQKKLLGAYNITCEIFNQGSFLFLLLFFFCGGGGGVLGGAAKRFGELMASFTTHQTIKSCTYPQLKGIETL